VTRHAHRDTDDDASGADEPGTEQFIGQRDLTRWSRPAQALISPVLRVSRYASANAVLVVTAAIGAGIAVLLTWASEEIYDSIKAADGLSNLDEPVLNLAISLRTPQNVAVAQFLTNLGGAVGLTIITVAILTIMTLRWRSRTPLLLLAIGTAGSLLMTAVGKELVGRARPPEIYAVPPYETSPSFPSGHALNNTVVACLVAYLLLLHLISLLWRIVSVSLAVAWFITIGLTRVFLGYHWLTDVVAGWLLGLAWVAVVISCHRLYLTVRRQQRGAATLTTR
jgi:membrane-associated phospholipid phosphatase